MFTLKPSMEFESAWIVYRGTAGKGFLWSARLFKVICYWSQHQVLLFHILITQWNISLNAIICKPRHRTSVNESCEKQQSSMGGSVVIMHSIWQESNLGEVIWWWSLCHENPWNSWWVIAVTRKSCNADNKSVGCTTTAVQVHSFPQAKISVTSCQITKSNVCLSNRNVMSFLWVFRFYLRFGIYRLLVLHVDHCSVPKHSSDLKLHVVSQIWSVCTSDQLSKYC